MTLSLHTQLKCINEVSPKTRYLSKSSFLWVIACCHVNQYQVYSRCWEVCSMMVFMRTVTVTVGLPSPEIMMYLFCGLSVWTWE